MNTKEITNIYADKLPGGVADNIECAEMNDMQLSQLKEGIEVEFEHTDDKDLAKEIAKDHNAEFPHGNYYHELKKMEENLEETEKRHKVSMDTNNAVRAYSQDSVENYVKELVRAEIHNFYSQTKFAFGENILKFVTDKMMGVVQDTKFWAELIDGIRDELEQTLPDTIKKKVFQLFEKYKGRLMDLIKSPENQKKVQQQVSQ